MEDLSLVYMGFGYEGSPTGLPFSQDVLQYNVVNNTWDNVKSCFGKPRYAPIVGNINNNIYVSDGLRWDENATDSGGGTGGGGTGIYPAQLRIQTITPYDSDPTWNVTNQVTSLITGGSYTNYWDSTTTDKYYRWDTEGGGSVYLFYLTNVLIIPDLLTTWFIDVWDSGSRLYGYRNTVATDIVYGSYSTSGNLSDIAYQVSAV